MMCAMHPTCIASDSGLPTCDCWCAQCLEEAHPMPITLTGLMRVIDID